MRKLFLVAVMLMVSVGAMAQTSFTIPVLPAFEVKELYAVCFQGATNVTLEGKYALIRRTFWDSCGSYILSSTQVQHAHAQSKKCNEPRLSMRPECDVPPADKTVCRENRGVRLLYVRGECEESKLTKAKNSSGRVHGLKIQNHPTDMWYYPASARERIRVRVMDARNILVLGKRGLWESVPSWNMVDVNSNPRYAHAQQKAIVETPATTTYVLNAEASAAYLEIAKRMEEVQKEMNMLRGQVEALLIATGIPRSERDRQPALKDGIISFAPKAPKPPDTPKEK